MKNSQPNQNPSSSQAQMHLYNKDSSSSWNSQVCKRGSIIMVVQSLESLWLSSSASDCRITISSIALDGDALEWYKWIFSISNYVTTSWNQAIVVRIFLKKDYYIGWF